MCWGGGGGQSKAYVAPGMPGFDANSYLQANPDIAQAFSQQSSVQSFAQKFPTADAYAAWHYQNYGQSEIAAGTRAALGTPGGPTQAEQDKATTDTLTTNLTGSTDKALVDTKTVVADATKTIGDAATTATDTIKGTATDVASLIQGQNTALTSLIGQFSTDFAKDQASLLERMTQASADQVSAIQKAIKDATESVGQAQKKPNYAQALARNKQLNGAGLSSTMLTGPAGVSSAALPLAATSLIGK